MFPHRLFFSSFLRQNFHEIDTNKDGDVSPEEIYDIKYHDVERLLGYLEEEEPEDEDQEGDNLDSTEEEQDAQDNTDREHTEL